MLAATTQPLTSVNVEEQQICRQSSCQSAQKHTPRTTKLRGLAVLGDVLAGIAMLVVAAIVIMAIVSVSWELVSLFSRMPLNVQMRVLSGM